MSEDESSQEKPSEDDHEDAKSTDAVDWFHFRDGCDPCLGIRYKGRFLVLSLPSDIEKTVAQLVQSIDRETF